MRPRKKILLWSEREDQAGQLAFMLGLHPHFTVTKAVTDAEFAKSVKREWDLVIVPNAVSPRRTANRASLAHRTSGCPVLILTWEGGYAAPELQEAVTLAYGATSAEIIQQVRTLTAGKRGPKRKPVQSVPTPLAEVTHAG